MVKKNTFFKEILITILNFCNKVMKMLAVKISVDPTETMTGYIAMGMAEA